MRDLFLGPRRYSELLKGLGGIPTDILVARLRTLQEQGILRQVGEGRGQRYELTESGQALGPVLRELGRWGADRLRLPADPTQIPTRVPLTSLLLGGAPYPRQAHGEYEVRVGEETVRVEVTAGQIHAAPRQPAGHHNRADPPRNEGTYLRRSRLRNRTSRRRLDPGKPATRPRLAKHPHRTAATSPRPPTTRSRRPMSSGVGRHHCGTVETSTRPLMRAAQESLTNTGPAIVPPLTADRSSTVLAHGWSRDATTGERQVPPNTHGISIPESWAPGGKHGRCERRLDARRPTRDRRREPERTRRPMRRGTAANCRSVSATQNEQTLVRDRRRVPRVTRTFLQAVRGRIWQVLGKYSWETAGNLPSVLRAESVALQLFRSYGSPLIPNWGSSHAGGRWFESQPR